MKRVLFLLAAALWSFTAFSQTKGNETIILKKDNGASTVIEIRDGKVIIDGQEIADANDTRSKAFSKTIVIQGDSLPANPMMGMNLLQDMMSAFGLDSSGSPAADKAMLGVGYQPDPGKGALVGSVKPGSPADKAGLQVGDRILNVDGRELTDDLNLTDVIAAHKPGDRVAIRYERNGRKLSANATLEAAPAPMARLFDPGAADEAYDGQMPNFFRMLPPNVPGMMPKKLGVDAEELPADGGVRIAGLEPGGAAAKAGLKEGDILTEADGRKIGDLSDLQLALNIAKNSMELQYLRDGRKGTVQIVFPEALRRQQL